MIDYQALKAEILNDPQNLGYATPYAAGQDQAVADILNTVRQNILIKRADISPSEVFHALALSDLASNPGAASVGYLQALLDAPFTIRLQNDDGSDTPVQTNVLALLKAGSSATKTRLAALATRQGSRAEQLFGANTFVQASDIVIVRSL